MPRKNYLSNASRSIWILEKKKLGNHSIYSVVDETTDACGRYITNMHVGVFNDSDPPVSYLIHNAALLNQPFEGGSFRKWQFNTFIFTEPA